MTEECAHDYMSVNYDWRSVFLCVQNWKVGVRVRVGLELGSVLGLDLGASELTAGRG